MALGVLGLLASLAAAADVGRRLARRWAVAAAPASRALVAAAVATALVLLAAEAAGSFGRFSSTWVGVLTAATWTAVVVVERRRAASPAPEHEPPARPAPGDTVAAIGAFAVAAGAWLVAARTGIHGSIQVDDLEYHLPHAAHIVRSGSTLELLQTATGGHWAFHPSNAELVHALTMSAFGTDVAVPVLNLLHVALLGAAAWALGGLRDRRALAVLAAAPAVLLPVVVTTNAGSGLTDVVALAWFLVAVALVHLAAGSGWATATTVLAGVAAGLAAGSKLSLVVPSVVLALVVAAAAARPLPRLLRWASGWSVGGAYWFARNALHTGSPMPNLSLPLLPSADAPYVEDLARSVVSRLGEDGFAAQLLDAVGEAFGPTWWALAAAWCLGTVVLLRGSRLDRAFGVGAAAMAVGYAATPGSALGTEAAAAWPQLVANTRYAVPALLVGLLGPVMATNRPGRGVGWAHAALAALGLGGALVALPSSATSQVLVALAAAGTAVLVVVLWRRPAPRPRFVAASVAVLAAAAAAAGVRIVDHDRYTGAVGDATPLQAVWTWAASLEDRRFGIVGGTYLYPLYGRELANDVEYVGVGGRHGTFLEATTCRELRRAARDAEVDVVVVHRLVGFDTPHPAEGWLLSAPGAREELRVDGIVAVTLPRPLDDRGCDDRRVPGIEPHRADTLHLIGQQAPAG